MRIGRAVLGVCVAVVLCGCAATGWEPGPLTDQVSEIPVPGVGTLKVSGERDTTVTIANLVGDGVHWPSADSIVIERSASGPLGTRGTMQTQVENQRIAAVERTLDKILLRLDQLMPLLTTPQVSPPAEPNLQQQLLLELLNELKARHTAEQGG